VLADGRHCPHTFTPQPGSSWRRVTFHSWRIRACVRTGIGRLASYATDTRTDALSVERLIGAVSVRAATLGDTLGEAAPLTVGTLRRFSTARSARRRSKPPTLIRCADQPALAIRVLGAPIAFSSGLSNATSEQQRGKNMCRSETENRWLALPTACSESDEQPSRA